MDDLLSGLKKFEIRLNDRDYKVGDFLEFTDERGVYVFAVRYIRSGLGLQEGYVCMTVAYMPYSSRLVESKLTRFAEEVERELLTEEKLEGPFIGIGHTANIEKILTENQLKSEQRQKLATLLTQWKGDPE